MPGGNSPPPPACTAGTLHSRPRRPPALPSAAGDAGLPEPGSLTRRGPLAREEASRRRARGFRDGPGPRPPRTPQQPAPPAGAPRRAHPSRRVCRDHSSPPRPLPPPPHGVRDFRLARGGCGLGAPRAASANPSSGRRGDIISWSRRGRFCHVTRATSPPTHLLHLKRPLHFWLQKGRRTPHPQTEFVFLEGSVQGRASHGLGPVGQFFRPLTELRKRGCGYGEHKGVRVGCATSFSGPT